LAAAGASSPRLRELLSQVASDEAEHAELAWRFVRWALEQQPALSQVVEEELAYAVCPPPIDAVADDASLRGLGILSPRDEAVVREAALREVIEPCAAALLERARAELATPPVLATA
jgi:hypothetical protein